MSQEPLRVGVLLESEKVSIEEFESLKRVLSEHPVNLTTVALSNRENISRGPDHYDNPVVYLISELLKNRLGVLIGVDFHIGKIIGEEACRGLNEEVWGGNNITDLLETYDANIIEYNLETVEATSRYNVPDKIVEEFRETADVIVNFEHGILEGDILNATEYGVLSHHSSDIREYRGRPPHIWQYINNESHVGMTIQQLTPVLDGGCPVMIKHQKIQPTDTLWDIKYKQRGVLPEMYSEVVRKIWYGDFDPQPLDDPGQLTHSSDKHRWSVVARVLIKNMVRRIVRAIS